MLILTAVQNLVHNWTIMERLFRAASSEETFEHKNSLGGHIYTWNVYVYISLHTLQYYWHQRIRVGDLPLNTTIDTAL